MAMFKNDSYRPEAYQHLEHPVPEWFAAAKLGIFVHWGAYSVPAWAEPLGELGSEEDPGDFARNPYAEWYANTIRIPGSPAAEHHAATYGDADYYDFLDQWKAESFDADALAELVRSTGARYFVPTSKHHDGITLWDAPRSEGLNTVDRGPHRNLVAEMAEAMEKVGVRFGAYYSGGLDWHFTGLPALTEKPAEVGADFPGRPNDKAYADYAYEQTLDLIERYKPAVLWGDIDWPDAGKEPGPTSLLALFDRYYEVVPDGVVNDRWGDTHWDFRTSEYQESPELGGEVFENCRGIGYSFGHNTQETAAHTLDGGGAVRHFVDIVAQGGNLLLNIGLTADGSVPPLQRQTLEALGAWNARNGAAVFGTSVAGPELVDPAGAAEGWVRFTRGDGVLNVVLGEPGEVVVPVVAGAVDPAGAAVLGGGDVTAEVVDDGLLLRVTGVGEDGLPVVVTLPLT
ncbi:alpha-L-fucosidase [Nocardioides sp. GY 10127]|uniref:alpha-L-fucosidase n=1 Tax=Nocardioides sp. GY 10127 TaxID=2569762 RepID=UPI0010A77816|nr:alpha-L-fucosidase [Nocardioides sp. GY 10127]TIC79337.1 alpha-L-fucosidase [Nocardioides sp. GY 10127]